MIVDCAPTGETLRLLSLPDVIQWYMERVFPLERRVIGALRPLAKKLTNVPLPDDRVYAAIHRFYDKLEGVRRVLTDATTTSVRLVVNPERMVIAEARRTFTYLSLFGYRVDAVVANRLLPTEVVDPYFARWKELHAQHLATIQESFSPVPVLTARLHDQELVGAPALLGLGQELYEELEPAEVLHLSEPMSIDPRGEGFVLTLELPFTRKEDLELSRKEDEMFVKVGPYRRTLLLPHMLASREVTSAHMVGDRVEVEFQRATS